MIVIVDAGAHPLDMVMMATAIFPMYDPTQPAALSAKAESLLRNRLGFQGVTITDALESPTGNSPAGAGVRAAAAGADVELFTDEARPAFGALLAAARRGLISRANLALSYARIVALKQRIR